MLVLWLACMIGIFSRPIGFLAAFWPANAIMLGLLLRDPRLSHTPITWICMLLTYVAADLTTGSSLFIALNLNVANVLSVLTGWIYLHTQDESALRLQRQRSVLTVFTGCSIAAFCGTAAGAWPSSIAFDVPLWRAAMMWLSTEFYNFVLILPVLLAAPRSWSWQWALSDQKWTLTQIMPLIALLFSEALSLMLPGPGSIAFIIPAMVWCAMSYGVFPTALLNLIIAFWKTSAISFGAFSFTPDHVMEVASFRTGLALLSMAPLAVACAYSLRLQALQKLHHAVSHDFLTGVLARRALMERGQKLLLRLAQEDQPVAVLMIDIDHFKSVNDRFDHAQGDLVLQEFAMLTRKTLRPDDLIGRMGGEEFAIVLPRTDREQALLVAQRLCERLRDHSFPGLHQGPPQVTLSIGLHAVRLISAADNMEQLLSRADVALYIAKNSGRNQVRQYTQTLAPSAF